MPVTTMAGYSLVGDRNRITSSEEAEVVLKTRLQEEYQQGRPQTVYFGRQHERPEMIDVLIIQEDSKEDQNQTASCMESTTRDKLDSAFSGACYWRRVSLEPFDNLKPTLECPVTEIAMFHFPDEPPADYLDIFHEFRTAAENEEDCGLLASAGGIAHECVVSEETMGKAVMFVAGWRSMESHKDFKHTNTYREHMPRLVQGITRVEAHHVSFQRLL